MFFTPKKRGRDWYWFHMMFLYVLAFAFGAGSIGALASTDVAFSERIGIALIFSFVTVALWKMGRHCSTIVAKMRDSHD